MDRLYPDTFHNPVDRLSSSTNLHSLEKEIQCILLLVKIDSRRGAVSALAVQVSGSAK